MTAHAVLLLALLLAACLLIQEAWPRKAEKRWRAEGFQQSVGGLGMGAVIAPFYNFRDYDPRLQAVAEDTLFPLPGGAPYAPDRLATISFFPESGR